MREGRLDAADLAGGSLDTVVIAGVDMYGRLIGKRIPVRRWEQTAEEGLHICTCVYGWDVAQDLGALRVDYAGQHNGWPDFRLVPDVTTLRPAAWLDRTAIVLADAVEEHGGNPVRVAPRSVLRQVVASADAAGYRALTATELEFHLYHGTPAELRATGYRDLAPTTQVHADYNIAEGDGMDPWFAAVRAALEASGVPVEVAQVEYGLGQWEINLEYADPLEMADRHVLFKHVIRVLAARHGMTATFMPRPLSDGMGSSCHVHLSLRDGSDRAVFHDADDPAGISDVLRHAVGGVLGLAPELMLWYAPTINSMRRLLTEDFAGNGLTWGRDNRTTTCRVLPGAPSATRLEMRLAGADANPYLVVSAVLASALEGIASKTDPGPPVVGDGYQTEGGRLPRTLGEAATAFGASPAARRLFGDDVVDHYRAVADAEWDVFLRAVSDWDRHRYMESI